MRSKQQTETRLTPSRWMAILDRGLDRSTAVQNVVRGTVRSAVIAAGVLIVAAAAEPVLAQGAPVVYEVSFGGRENHEAQITARFTDLGREPLELRMSRTSPGRYRLHEFAKNLYSLTASNELGEPLAIEHLSPSSWRISEHAGAVEVRYTLFGDLLSGTYSAIDASFAVLNPPSAFVWAAGLENRPVDVVFDLPLGWDVVSQIPQTGSGRLGAPNLAYFLDSPIGLGTFDQRSWRVDALGRSIDGRESADQETGLQTIRMAVGHRGDTALVDRLQQGLALLVAEAAAVFGGLPQFDYGVYSFIANYFPFAHGDAMEHRNSTVHSSSASLATEQPRLLGTLVHEFIHVWNVERIRPKSLEPFDFMNLNLSSELWFGEGFTSYYDGLLMARAGLLSEEEYLQRLTRTIDRFANSPAHAYGGAARMSRRAAFNDRAVWVDPRNAANTYLHYYSYGEALALALDLSLRSDHGTTLDALMRRIWAAHPEVDAAYTNDDLQALLSAEASPEFAEDFFSSYIHAGGVPDFGRLLGAVGLSLERTAPGEPWLGVAELGVDAKGVVLRSPSREGDPLYGAGLSMNDRLLELGDRKLDDLTDVERALRRVEPGQSLRVVSERRGEWRAGLLTVGEDPTLVVRRSQQPSDAATAARRAWLDSGVQAPEPATGELGDQDERDGGAGDDAGAPN